MTLTAVLVLLIVFAAFVLGFAVHPWFFLLLLLCAIVFLPL